MVRLRFILVCFTLAISVFAWAEAAWAEQGRRRDDADDRSVEAHGLIIALITAKTPEAAKAASDRLSREFNIVSPDRNGLIGVDSAK